MRKTLMIVLIAALTLVIGSASSTSAAKPSRTAIAGIDSVNATGFYVHWMWNNWGAWAYQLHIYDLSDPAGARWTGSVEWQDKKKKYMATAGYPNPVHYGFDTFSPDPTHDYAIQLTLFKKNGAILKQASSSWSPTFCTVTLDETNDLSDVAIQVFFDSGLTNPIGDRLTTDNAGNTAIDLPDGATYYYEAAKINYYEVSRSFTLAGANLTENFTMKPFNTVTFAEANELSNVSIQLHTDSEFQDPVGDPLTTNSSGEATIKLPNQTFYYAAAKTGYSDASGNFTLFDAPSEVDFEMLAGLYTVTFNERNGLRGVSIVVYSDPGRTDDIFSGTTNSSGQATCTLPDATYYYTAAKTSYATLPGDFTVSGAPLTESFEMVTSIIIFAEDFTGIASGDLPSGWTTTNSSLCRVYNANHAGGSVPELKLGCAPDYDVYLDYYVATPSIDATTTSSALNLSFKSFFSLYGDNSTYPYTYVVQTSDNGGATWITVLEESPTLATYPSGEFKRTECIDISACVGQAIMIRWRLYGYTWWMNAWHIDDILVTGS